MEQASPLLTVCEVGGVISVFKIKKEGQNMASIKYKDNKLGRYRKGVQPFQSADGNRVIEAKFEGKCAVCPNQYKVGERVLFNPDKEPGKRVVHISCYMRRNRK